MDTPSKKQFTNEAELIRYFNECRVYKEEKTETYYATEDKAKNYLRFLTKRDMPLEFEKLQPPLTWSAQLPEIASPHPPYIDYLDRVEELPAGCRLL